MIFSRLFLFRNLRRNHEITGDMPHLYIIPDDAQKPKTTKALSFLKGLSSSCERWDSNPYTRNWAQEPESCASTNSATLAVPLKQLASTDAPYISLKNIVKRFF